MAKLRIVPYGHLLKVQKKVSLWWVDCRETVGPAQTQLATFGNRRQAVEWIKERYGSAAQIDDG